ncbi:MAG TPA: hypothetical protein VH137_00310 [Gemmatimonadales bacterium]|jgi:hypothetical protein|nr:hypothetical protein [Gemmatimonadales bacterium]
MKAYVVTTGTLFALLALVHLWRLVAEWPHLGIVAAGIGVLAAGLAVWAWRLVRLSARP